MDTKTELPQAHSPLGGSGAERWIACPGSVVKIEALRARAGQESEDEEPEYRREGSAAHEAAAHALKNNLEGWELVNMKFLGLEVSPTMVDDLETYLETVRAIPEEEGVLDVTDFKFGMGVVVDVEHNEQLMYYAFGLLDNVTHGRHTEYAFHRPDLHQHYYGTADYAVVGPGETKKIRLRIVQPRAFHRDGAVRVWEVSVNDLRQWGKEVLIPAMDQTEWDESLTPGDHCRFCEARTHCEAIAMLKEAVLEKVEQGIDPLPLDVLVNEYVTYAPIKMRIKAVEEAVYNQLNRGFTDDRVKLVSKRADRIWKDGAAAEAKALFGDDVMEPPTMKGPPGIDKLGPKGKAFTKEHAYTPHTGTTVALKADRRAPVNVQTRAETFAKLIEGEKANGNRAD